MPRLTAPSSAVAWRPWGREAFARARDERKPVLLSITTAWCRWSREMDRTTYADPAIAAIINGRFVPIRVDADRRPDVSERYSLGGWPTTAFLSPDGAILGGGTFVAHARMPGVLAKVAAAFDARAPQQPAAAAADVGPPRKPDPIDPAALHRRIFESFDARHAGFGGLPKFPHVAPLRLALDLFRETGDARYESILLSTLDAMGWGGIYDDVDGGFFRCATTAEWRAPRTEKLLDINAGLFRLYLDAGIELGIGRFTERAADTLRYIQTWLADAVDGGWSGSQAADDEYYAAPSAEARRVRESPPVSHILYADANATMISAAIHAGRTNDDPELTSFAIRSLERVLPLCYKPGAGVSHFVDEDEDVRGLLADQVSMTAACLDSFDVTGNVVYEMVARELAHFTVRVLWDDVDGGFFDAAIAPDAIGLLQERIKPMAANCDAASILRRLAQTSGEAGFAGYAERTLEAMGPPALEQGPFGAHYALALRAARAG